mmetsp:Transcript_25444/g.63838  ORF Transcript_25444/g.63838 Transcript_25444/m.63838 type:complete len:101 (-) Transcript_25444:187-489(-)
MSHTVYVETTNDEHTTYKYTDVWWKWTKVRGGDDFLSLKAVRFYCYGHAVSTKFWSVPFCNEENGTVMTEEEMNTFSAWISRILPSTISFGLSFNNISEK